MKFRLRLSKLPKRSRFIFSTLILSSLLLFSTFYFFDKAIIFVPLILIATYLLTYFSILEKIDKIEWFSLFLGPTLFSIAFYLFYFLFPSRWLTRLPFVIIYAISIYALISASNILDVGVEKPLKLYRAAFSINYLYQNITLFLLFSVFFSLKFGPFLNGLFTSLVTLLISLQFFWSINPSLELSMEIREYAFLIGILVGELSVVFSFLPIHVTIFALFLASFYYMLSGLSYAYLDNMFFKKNIQGYVATFALVAVIALVSLI